MLEAKHLLVSDFFKFFLRQRIHACSIIALVGFSFQAVNGIWRRLPVITCPRSIAPIVQSSLLALLFLPCNFLILEAKHLPVSDFFFGTNIYNCSGVVLVGSEISECSLASRRELLGTWIRFWIKPIFLIADAWNEARQLLFSILDMRLIRHWVNGQHQKQNSNDGWCTGLS